MSEKFDVIVVGAGPAGNAAAYTLTKSGLNVLQLVFGLFASMIAMWFSRHREFRADIAGAELASREKMIAALERLQANHGESTLPKQVAAFGISGNMKQGLGALLLSHPPLPVRIEALRKAQLNASALREGVVV